MGLVFSSGPCSNLPFPILSSLGALWKPRELTELGQWVSRVLWAVALFNKAWRVQSLAGFDYVPS